MTPDSQDKYASPEYLDKAWSQMSVILDDELPQKDSKRLVYWWILGLILVSASAVLLWFSAWKENASSLVHLDESPTTDSREWIDPETKGGSSRRLEERPSASSREFSSDPSTTAVFPSPRKSETKALETRPDDLQGNEVFQHVDESPTSQVKKSSEHTSEALTHDPLGNSSRLSAQRISTAADNTSNNSSDDARATRESALAETSHSPQRPLLAIDDSKTEEGEGLSSKSYARQGESTSLENLENINTQTLPTISAGLPSENRSASEIITPAVSSPLETRASMLDIATIPVLRQSLTWTDAVLSKELISSTDYLKPNKAGVQYYVEAQGIASNRFGASMALGLVGLSSSRWSWGIDLAYSRRWQSQSDLIQSFAWDPSAQSTALMDGTEVFNLETADGTTIADLALHFDAIEMGGEILHQLGRKWTLKAGVGVGYLARAPFPYTTTVQDDGIVLLERSETQRSSPLTEYDLVSRWALAGELGVHWRVAKDWEVVADYRLHRTIDGTNTRIQDPLDYQALCVGIRRYVDLGKKI